MGCTQTKVAPEPLKGKAKSSRLLAREASSSVRGKYGMFVSRDVGDGARDLANDSALREGFIQYVKSGAWLDVIALFINGPVVLSHEERLAKEKENIVYEYRTDSLLEIRSLIDHLSKQNTENLFSSFPRTPHEEGTDRRSSGPSKHSSMESMDACYVSIDNFCRMSHNQLVAVLFAILYPLFLRSPERAQLLGNAVPSDNSAASPSGLSIKDSRPMTKASRRAQELLLSCAARFDETILLQHLESSAWVGEVEKAFEDCGLPICIVDTNRENCPIVYVNEAFETMYGRTRDHILGKRLNLMNGPDTELTRFEMLQEAVRNHQNLKIAITNYNKRGDCFLNLVAMKASGGFTYLVHCPTNKHTVLEDVKVSSSRSLVLFWVLFATSLCVNVSVSY